MALLIVFTFLCASVPAQVKWLRVAQREHYIPSSIYRFAILWTKCHRVNSLVVLIAIVSACASIFISTELVVAANGLAAAFPIGLTMRGQTSRLVWTARMRRLVLLLVVLYIGIVALGLALPAPKDLLVWAFPLSILLPELALLISRPMESRIGSRHIRRAQHILETVRPLVIGITGSFGKTTTKAYVRHLLDGTFDVVASPASFNNAMGLARTVNEFVTPSTQILIAEIGTYGPGEIRSICKWLRPTIGAITAVGPVHLERMRSLETIRRAKAELFEETSSAIVAIDSDGLESLAEEIRRRGQTVITCSASTPLTTIGVSWDETIPQLVVEGNVIGQFDPALVPINVAVAAGVAIAAGLPVSALAPRLSTLPTPEHRLVETRSDSDIVVLDDTYNSNPEGAARALSALAHVAARGQRVLVTPGMVELGRLQASLNTEFAKSAARVADVIVIVGRTNRAALKAGLNGSATNVILVQDREAARTWLRANLRPGDAALYENDLPDHYP